MPILTFTAPTKGTPETMTLDKAELAAISSVDADDYFKLDSNWKRVNVYYKSTVGNQNVFVSFDATKTTPTSDFFVSNTARDLFNVSHIIIVDFDSGIHRIERSELTTAEFDVSFPIIGENWTGRAASSAVEWIHVAFDGTNFSASNLTNGDKMYSADGESWSASTSVTGNAALSIAGGNGVFLCLNSPGGGNMGIEKSTNGGVNYTTGSLGAIPISYSEGRLAYSVIGGQPRFVLVDKSDIGASYYSDDGGDTWIEATTSIVGTIREVTGSPTSGFMAVSNTGTHFSADGITWGASVSISGYANTVAYGNGTFVVGTVTNGVYHSTTNGTSWTHIPIGSLPSNLSSFQGSAYANGVFVLISATSPDRILTSDDLGLTWTLRSAPEDNLYRGTTAGNNNFVSVASTGTNRVMTSPY